MISKMLKESVLNPKDNGPLQLVIDEHLNDPEYLEKKAKELIDEAQYAMRGEALNIYHEKMQKAIFFAGVARCIRKLLFK